MSDGVIERVATRVDHLQGLPAEQRLAALNEPERCWYNDCLSCGMTPNEAMESVLAD